MNQRPSAKQSLEDLKRQLAGAKPVVVDQQGRLSTVEEQAMREKMGQAQPGDQAMKVKPSRWF